MHELALAPSQAVLRTIFLCDLVDSTKCQQRLGDTAWAALSARHDRAARDLFAKFGGREIDKTDGFLVLFERPLDAVRCALAYHAAMESLDGLTARAGIHLGEVIVRENSPEDIARGAKTLDVEGLAKPTAARIMSLAVSGQTLLTRGAFDVARTAARGGDSLGGDVQWLAHGPYVIKGVEEPFEVFEAGVVGRAPLSPPGNTEKVHRAIRPGEEGLLGWRPAPGQAVKRRPGWILIEKLGEGGFGEVWLARHERTKEARVFKFCFAFERLKSLKRELTLFLLIKEALGEREDIQRLYDLNFDEPPYFLEMDYAEGGSLVVWAQTQGGIGSVPLATRLELVAQVASATAAAHSLGILHKDIKPGNVLVEAQRATVHAKLTDFGIGQLADTTILQQVNVHATGFTADTLGKTELSSRTGTRLYMAPELLAGKLPSIQSDVFSLGVMLYQVVVGDLETALPTDWEKKVSDPLLREDIGACVAGEANERLASAAEMATRLRSLDARRRARRRRNLARASGVATVLLAVALGVALWWVNRERDRAETERGLRELAEIAELDANRQRDRAVKAREEAEQARAEQESLILYMLGELTEQLEPLGKLEILQSVFAEVEASLRKPIATDTPLPRITNQGLLMLRFASLREREGDLAGSEEYARRATDLFESIYLKHSDDIQLGINLSMARLALADILSFSNRKEESMMYYERARELILKVAEKRGNEDDTRQLALVGSRIAGQHQSAGRLEQASNEYHKALDIFSALLTASPGRKDIAMDVSSTCGNLGAVASAQNNHSLALEYFEKDRQLMEHLMQQDGDDVHVKLALIHALNQLAGELHHLGHVEEEITVANRRLELASQLASHDPKNLRWAEEEAYAHQGVASAQKAAGRLQASLSAEMEGLTIWESILSREPSNSEWMMGSSVAYNNVGGLLILENRFDEAIGYLKRSIEIKRELISRHPNDFAAKRGLAVSVGVMGVALQRLGRSSESIALHEEALSMIRSVLAATPEDNTYVRDLGIFLTRLAEARAMNGDDSGGEPLLVEAVSRLSLVVEPNDSALLRAKASLELARKSIASSMEVSSSTLGIAPGSQTGY